MGLIRNDSQLATYHAASRAFDDAVKVMIRAFADPNTAPLVMPVVAEIRAQRRVLQDAIEEYAKEVRA